MVHTINKKKDRFDDKLNEKKLQQIFANLPDPILVTDKNGNVLLSNSTTAMTLDISLNQLLKSNVKDLVSKSLYDESYIMEAVRKKKVVSGLVKTRMNYDIISTCTPIFDEEGSVQFVITTSRSKEILEEEVPEYVRMSNYQQKRENEYLQNYVLENGEIVAESNTMKNVLFSANSVAQTDSSVLLYGETGTGKEVMAKYLHRHSKRAEKNFIAINCAAIPEQLVESEFFGYEKGAYTGAAAGGKIGLFEAADCGTLFLDEIAELPLNVQSKLLRVIETSEVRRVGSNKNRRVDFRLIAATHKDLKKMTEEGSFRSDLYYRLNVFPITIPPLCERREDILALALKFLKEFNRKYELNLELNSEDLEKLQSYKWPGNIRELRNEIERRVISSLHDYPSPNHPIYSSELSSDMLSKINIFELLGLDGSLEDVMKNIEKMYIDHIMNMSNGKVSEAAKRLDIHRSAIYRKIKGYK